MVDTRIESSHVSFSSLLTPIFLHQSNLDISSTGLVTQQTRFLAAQSTTNASQSAFMITRQECDDIHVHSCKIGHARSFSLPRGEGRVTGRGTGSCRANFTLRRRFQLQHQTPTLAHHAPLQPRFRDSRYPSMCRHCAEYSGAGPHFSHSPPWASTVQSLQAGGCDHLSRSGTRIQADG
jgi:hypothetical protein